MERPLTSKRGEWGGRYIHRMVVVWVENGLSGRRSLTEEVQRVKGDKWEWRRNGGTDE
jgi:hypothetical protein